MEAKALSHDVYYQGIYWNDYELVRSELNRRATGSNKITWQDHFISSTRPQFSKALIINCGNGWVERDLFDRGMFSHAVAFDASDELLLQAENSRNGRPITYKKIDGNEITLDSIGKDYDLVVNHAACHHVGRLYRFMRVVSSAMRADGIMLNWDYVGADRNQYPYSIWEKIIQCNEQLPLKMRADLAYPHLPTMLATDPSEAIRSSAILPAFKRYFSIDHLAMLGGGLAYPVITHNQGLAKTSITESEPIIKQLLVEDEHWCRDHPDHNLFAYWWGKPLRDDKTNTCSDALESAEDAWFSTHANFIPLRELSLLQRLTQKLSEFGWRS